MKTQQIYNRQHWLAVKQRIGINSLPSFLNTDCESRGPRYRNPKYNGQENFYIDILGILNKLSIFFKVFSSLFTFSFQTEWQKEKKINFMSILK